MAKRHAQQIIKVKSYGDDWIDRLAVLLQTIDKMESPERAAAFRFMKSKYSSEWPGENY